MWLADSSEGLHLVSWKAPSEMTSPLLICSLQSNKAQSGFEERSHDKTNASFSSSMDASSGNKHVSEEVTLGIRLMISAPSDLLLQPH